MEVAASNSQMIKNNKSLPDGKRNSHVLLKFLKPIKRSAVREFFRIHLTPDMHSAGEEVKIHRGNKGQLCRRCGQQMDRPAEAWCMCRNDSCENAGKRVYTGEPRGVVNVLIFDEFISHTETVTEKLVNGNPMDLISGKLTLALYKALPTVEVKSEVEFVNCCLLVLDRNYPDSVLAGVYRAAGTICDMNQWALE